MKVVLLALTALLVAGCSDPIEVANLAPRVRHHSVETNAEEPVSVYYTIEDAEGDDVHITIEVCSGDNACDPMTEAPGGDGTANLPTLRRERVLHLFTWDAECDAGQNEQVFIRITPRDEDLGRSADGDTFSLADIGYAGSCN